MSRRSFLNSKCYGGIIYCSTTKKYLLVKGKTGIWSFPKGHRELNETPYTCAKREIYEETGLKIDNIENKPHKFISLYHYFDIVFDEELPVNPIDKEEIYDIKWLTLEEIIPIDKNKDVDVYFRKLMKKQNNVENIENSKNIEKKL